MKYNTNICFAEFESPFLAFSSNQPSTSTHSSSKVIFPNREVLFDSTEIINVLFLCFLFLNQSYWDLN